MAYSYSKIQRYRVTAKDGQTFEGFVFASNEKDRSHELWIYGDVQVSMNEDALRRQYDEQVHSNYPFEGFITPVGHVATIVDAAVVVPVGGPLTLDELEQRNKRRVHI